MNQFKMFFIFVEMKKLRKTIRAVFALLQNPWLLNHVLSDDIVWQKYLTKNHKHKQSLPIVQLDQVSPGFHEKLDCFAFLDGGSLPTDLALLKSLCRKFEHCNYFEIGTWRGESVTNMATVSQTCTTLNLSKEEILQHIGDEKYADQQAFFSRKIPNIKHIKANSRTFDYAGLNQKFDVIFIDGDHSFDAVKHDTSQVFEHLLHDKSVVVWHDYGYTPEQVRPEILAAILEGTPEKFHGNLYHVANTMCAIMIRENFETFAMNPPLTPSRSFSVDIKAHEI